MESQSNISLGRTQEPVDKVVLTGAPKSRFKKSLGSPNFLLFMMFRPLLSSAKSWIMLCQNKKRPKENVRKKGAGKNVIITTILNAESDSYKSKCRYADLYGSIKALAPRRVISCCINIGVSAFPIGFGDILQCFLNFRQAQ